jgi:hypothetical protein
VETRELGFQRQQLDAQRAELATMRAALAKQQSALEESRQRWESDRARRESERRAVDQQCENERAREREELQAARVQWENERTQLRSDLEAARQASRAQAAPSGLLQTETVIKENPVEHGDSEPDAAWVEARNVQLAQYHELLAQRETALRDMKRVLASSEAEMVRRWSTRRSALVVAVVVLAVGLLAAISYAIGRSVVDPVWLATAVVEADSGHTPQAEWLRAQRRVLLSDAVLNETINQLDQRGVALDGGVPELRNRLRSDLEIRPDVDDRLVLELRQAQPESSRNDVYYQVEALSRAFVGYHRAEDRKAGRSPTARIFAMASVERTPVEDRRFTVAAEIFILALAGTTAIAMFVRRRLLRAQRASASAGFAGLESWA